ncbi:hypothetical protein [Autumnicola edwardsiae]|uniref:Uncharacterized protein n=1 Tax=Autumnicola edwardsiae TaxID=3075594 RepID=A0ABU3CSU0_9FLAO|nr:hypothetical protein [Zunongwangia sp. F297]MDT0649366.1 hypothetical protein [Zunongwangia sp. F297]
MKTIEIKVKGKIYERVISALQQFDSEDLQILEEGRNQHYLKKQLLELESGDAEFVTMSELEQLLEKRIQEYEG